MFFILSKATLFLLSPFTWFVVSSLIFLFWKKQLVNTIAKWTSLAILIIFTNPFLFLETARIWEIHGTTIELTKKYDVGIVLTGMAEYDTELKRISIRRGADRIWQAISLYQLKKIKKILISGDSGYITDRGLHEAKQFKSILIQWGIPEKDIITEETSRNTHENAVETQNILNRSYPHLSRFLLITSGMHMRRSIACFENEGVKVTPFSTDLYTSDERSYFWDQYIIPNVEYFEKWNHLTKEVFGYITYDLVGYID
jgi:uncharacterized SAM-binding protein YcdF (DUF218 family)